MTKKHLSLFSGCGGMDLGFEGGFHLPKNIINDNLTNNWIDSVNKQNVKLKKTKFETVFANDILQPARSAWIPFFENYGKDENDFILKSIVDIVKEVQNNNFSFPENIDIITGGFPCQDFSVAGNRKGFKSDKSHNGGRIIDEPSIESRGFLYFWMKSVIEIIKPKMFIAENVKGLTNLGDVKDIIENDFRKIDKNGYIVIPAKVINAANYGVPQNRERILFFGFNKNYMKQKAISAMNEDEIPLDYNPYPPITHFIYDDNSNNFKSLKKYTCVGDVLFDLKEPEEELNDLSQQSYSKAKFTPKSQGNIEINLSKLSPTIRAEHHGNIEYRRLSSKNGGKLKNELNDGKKERRLTVRECARIQTFPDNYEFVRSKGNYKLSASSAYKLIGNAVPPFLSYNIAMHLENIWDNIFLE